MWEALVRVEIHLDRKLRTGRLGRPEVRFKLGSVEDFGDVPGQRGVIRIALAANVVAGKFRIPALVVKLPNGAAVDLLFTLAETVLVQKVRKLLIDAGIVWIVIHFTAQNSEGLRQLLESHQAREIAVQHLLVLR